MSWLALATGSALLSAAAAIAQKRVLQRLGALELSFLATAAVLLLAAWVPLREDVLALTPRAAGVLAAKSLVGAVAFLLVMRALERHPISGALPVMGLTPAVTALLATVLLRDTLRPGEWLGLALVTAGLWALESREGRGPFGPFGAVFGTGRHRHMLGAVLLFALSSVGDKLLLTGMRVPPNVVLFHQHVVYLAVFGAMLLARRAPAAALARGAREQWPLLLAIAACTLGYRFLQLEATQAGPVALVLAVKRTSIVYASLAGGRLFAEERLAPRVIAAVLIVGAGFLFLGRE